MLARLLRQRPCALRLPKALRGQEEAPRGVSYGGIGTPPQQRAYSSKGATPSSSKWLARQDRDPFVKQARAEHLRSRAALKLAQIDDVHRILRPGHTILDLGAAPGGWSQVAATRTRPGSVVLGLDREPIEPLNGATFVQMELAGDTAAAAAAIRRLLPRPEIDVLLRYTPHSDMAPAFTGNPDVDHLRHMVLCELAAGLADILVAEGGTFVVKVLHGSEEVEFYRSLAKHYTSVKRFKPAASRQESRELYFVALGRRPRPA